MGDEAVDGSKMGTKLIMFVAIIGLALAAFLVGKSLINTGVDNMESSSKSINDSRFSDYNKKIVKGRAVKSAIDTFQNEEVIILVHTLSEGTGQTANVAGGPTGGGTYSKGADLQTWLGRDADDNTLATKITDATFDSNAGIGKGGAWAVNYNALLDGKNAVTAKDGGYVYDADFMTDSKTGAVQYNLNTKYLTKKGQPEYIADGSSFDAALIKNSSGEIVGIVFSQKKLG